MNANTHEAMLDNVAVYALGALPLNEAQEVRAHLETCEQCREEYRLLQPAVLALAYCAQARPDAKSTASSVAPPSPMLKRRIMRQVRPNVGEMRAVRPIVWPAYAVAAACLAIALVTGIIDISLNSEVRQNQSQMAQMNAHSAATAQRLAHEQTALADMVSPDSVHYTVNNGEVVRHGSRLYIAMGALPAAPKGKVYQAWTLHAGATRMSPSVTFVPNRSGVAVVPLPVNASTIVAVAVSVEPDGGSKQPTSKPDFVLKLS